MLIRLAISRLRWLGSINVKLQPLVSLSEQRGPGSPLFQSRQQSLFPVLLLLLLYLRACCCRCSSLSPKALGPVLIAQEGAPLLLVLLDALAAARVIQVQAQVLVERLGGGAQLGGGARLLMLLLGADVGRGAVLLLLMLARGRWLGGLIALPDAGHLVELGLVEGAAEGGPGGTGVTGAQAGRQVGRLSPGTLVGLTLVS